MDTSDEASIKAAGEALEKDKPGGIDVLINNAGVSGKGRYRPIEQDIQDFKDIMAVNILGPYLVVRALLPLIRKGRKKQIFNMSSGLASMGNLAANLRGEGIYQFAASYGLAYRASKAALCMETLSLAADLKPEGITVVSMDPGWVRTDMGGPTADIEAPESIAGQLKVYDAVTEEDTGKFYKYDGSIVPF